MNRRLRRRVGLLAGLAGLLALAACQPAPPAPAASAPTTPPSEAPPTSAPTAPPTPTPPPDPAVARVNLGAPPQTLDPALIAPLDSSANDLAANLFAGLAQLDGDTGRVTPVLAQRWEQVNPTTWNVHLRDDIAWVQADPATGAVEPVRPVTAGDVVAAVRRACHPATGALLGSKPALFLIQGCAEVSQRDPALLTPEYVAQVLGVRVLNDTALEFKLTQDSALFPTLLATLPLAPVPADLVESAGAAWTEPGTLWTSGPFALQDFSDAGATLVANPHWPLPRAGNLDAVQAAFGQPEEAFSAWQAGGLDLTVVPGSQVGGADFENDPAYRQLALPAVEFLVASYDHAPVNDALVRQALALALDRQRIIDEVLEPAGQAALPAHGLVPPGMALAPPAEAGVAYDLDAARARFAEAGFRDCAFMPTFTLLTTESSSELAAALAEAYVAQWNAAFDCGNRIAIEERPLVDVLAMLEALPEGYRLDRPGLVLLGWQADYPDAHHWLADIAGCRELFPESVLGQGRECILAEEELLAASAEHDEEARAAIYRDITEAFFGPGGEMPVIPVLTYTRPLAVNPWLEVSPQQAGPLRFGEWRLDAQRQP